MRSRLSITASDSRNLKGTNRFQWTLSPSEEITFSNKHKTNAIIALMKCARYIWIVVILLCILINGCVEEIKKPEKHSPYTLPLTERDFYIGMVPTPKSVPETTFEDITAAYEEVGQLGEVTMVWGSPGGIGLYERLKQNRVVTSVRVYRLKPVITLNFHTIKQIHGEGLKPVVDAPEGIVAEASNPEFRILWVDEARKIAEEFQPEYLSLGNEINDYFYYNPNDLENYLTLFDEAYSAIKQASPNTQVMVVFSYTHLIDNNQWNLFDRFQRADIIGLTTYPWKHFSDPEEIDGHYYSRLNQYIKKPVAFTEIGWAGNETEQAEFLVRFLELTKDMDTEMVNWLFLHEIELEGIGKSVFSPESTTIALKKVDGTKKEIYDVWLDLKAVEMR